MNEKRSKVIEYLSENCSGETAVTLLMQFMTEENWEQLYDQLEKDGVPDFCEQEELSDFDKAIAYVRENMDADDMAILRAEMNKFYNMHLIPNDGVMDCSEVIDLLEEYGEENDLPEGWWEEYGEMDEWLAKL